MAGVQFILGRSGSGKTRWCIDAVCEALTAAGDGPLVLLVPEQATYQAERAILSHPDIKGFSRLHVLSFNRLQFRLLPGRGGAAEVSRTGKQMILHKILLELAGQLTLYKGDVQRMGLAAKLSDLLGELQHADCTPKQIRTLADALGAKPGQELAAAKWTDIAAVFEAYETFFASAESRFKNPDIELTLAREMVASAPFLQGARLWVDGFSGFSVQERDLLVEMLKVCKDASIALCLDLAAIDLANDDEDKLDPCSLFASTEQTYCQLLRVVRGCKLRLREPVVLDKPLRFSEAPALAALEANFVSDKPAKPVLSDGALQIAACGHVRAETLWVAGQIRALVKDSGYRYRQIAVVVPDMDAYQHYIESAFNQYELPYFLDRPRRMKTHPLTELIGAALQAVENGFTSSDVLSFISSPLAGTSFDQVDALGNYCQAFDVQGAEWLQKPAWRFASDTEKQRYDEPAMDALRRELIAPLRTLEQALTDRETISAGQFTQAVWQLLQTLDVQSVLGQWAAEDATDQRFGHRQIFAGMVGLMDELCAVFEGIEMPVSAWGSIFTGALASETIKLIPPTLDQVLVGSIERSRHPDIKAIFLIGATQKQFPVPVAGETLLTEQDYQLAASGSLELANPYDVSLTHRPYLAYIALTRASKRVYLSYPLLDEKGSAVVPWSGIEQLTAMFTDVAVRFPQASIQDANEIQNPHQLGLWLSQRLGKDRTSVISDPSTVNSQEIGARVLHRMADSDDPSLKQTAALVEKSLGYDNAATMDAGLAEKLFHFPMTMSVTRMGTFAKCPYQYFAKYTLGLEKRQLLRFEPMDVGTFYHDVLEAIFKALKQRGADWGDLSVEDLVTLCDAESEKVLSSNTLLVNFMRKRSHHRYIIQSAREVLRLFVPMLGQLSRASRFKQAAAELKFGFDDTLRLVVPLNDGRQIHLRGLIDRLDVADIDGNPSTQLGTGQAAVVFDYKSGGKSVDFAGMLYGLDLQLPVYLLAMGHQKMTPAGAFFLPIASGTNSAALSGLDAVEAGFNKAKGLFDGSFFDAIDTEAAPSGWSGYYNFYVNKDGEPYSFYNSSGALKPDDFQALLNYTEQRIKKLIMDLSTGCISITPYRIGTSSPCSWCDYRPLCRFDWQINDYNILETVNKEEAIEKMKGGIVNE
ncbi:MAG: exodeoxyribonuclease V subunit gamma [Phycisphaerae bacterium]|nr:exodeoxyribonuclease V subunit gamma [Phycisphaerae bacterium]